jgi:hypothetical protein
MKKALFVLMAMMAVPAAYADDYPYLTFETTDGSKASVSTSQLTITIDGTTLTAGTQTFTLVNLAKMYFSTSDESTSATGVSNVMAADLDEAAEIYDLNGRRITRDQMHRGIYIIKTQKGTYKVNVK